LKFALPLLIVYFIYRGIKSVLFPKPQPREYFGGSFTRRQHSQAGGGHTPQAHTTIEICPDCGHERGPRHLCSASSGK
jgi:hypothetical protein